MAFSPTNETDDSNMSNNGLIYAYLLDGAGGAQKLGWKEIDKWTPEQGIIWLYFDYTDPEAREWILNKSQLDILAAMALLTDATRPRTTTIQDGILLALRGVNLNPDSHPEDMVSIRIWIDQHKIISTRKRRLLSVEDIVDSLEHRKGPKTPGEFIAELADRLISRMESSIEKLEDRVARLEEKILTAESHAFRTALSSLRREAIALRRYLAPQGEAMTRLQTEEASWISDTDRLRVREVTDRLMRYVEDLDSVRDRAAVTQEELINRLSEQMNKRMYVLSVAAVIFFKLGRDSIQRGY